jgi:predicted dehydrogenase
VRDIGVYPVVTTRLATGLEPDRVHAQVVLDPRFGTDRFARCTAEFPEFSMTFYCGTQLSRRQHMFFHGTKGWLSVEAPFNPGVYGPAQIRHRSDETGQTRTVEFGDTDQYQLMVEDFASVVLGQKAKLAFTLENSYGNQRVIDQILL